MSWVYPARRGYLFEVPKKSPGWDQQNSSTTVMDMSYSKSFPGAYVADAYERMFYNAAKGDGLIFVDSGECQSIK